MNALKAEIKYKINCPMCTNKVYLAQFNDTEYHGLCEFCDRKIILVDDQHFTKDGSIVIMLR